MAEALGFPARPISKRPNPAATNRRLADALSIAEEQWAAERRPDAHGARPHAIASLVEQAKKKTGIQSDSKLIEAALANIAVADEYGDWLLAQRGTVSKDLDLEF
jgi:hypothetical protein